jgi:hypothetical protein
VQDLTKEQLEWWFTRPGDRGSSYNFGTAGHQGPALARSNARSKRSYAGEKDPGRSLPKTPYTVRVKVSLIRHDDHVVAHRLSDQHPIEWIAVCPGESARQLSMRK